MAYIGNQPALSYTSFAKQDFTTSATTSYTLDNPVANANELALFINFVRQEPTTAYTASGTSLTLTSATSASDDMYCVYLGKAVQTVTPANNSVTNAMLVDDTITGAKLSKPFNYDSGTLYLDDTNNRVGIGVTNLTRNLAIGTLGTKTDTSTKYVMNIGQTSESSSHAGLGVYYVGASSASDRKWQFQPVENGVANDGIIEFNTSGGRFRAINGIQLGGNTDANKLDDYEEGTWTPTFQRSGSTMSNIGIIRANYTKIGRIVHVNLAAVNNTSSYNNAFIIGQGLPFTNSSINCTGSGGGFAVHPGSGNSNADVGIAGAWTAQTDFYMVPSHNGTNGYRYLYNWQGGYYMEVAFWYYTDA